MIVLGLDTTGPDCSVSLVDEACIRAHISRNIGRGHAEVLAGMVEEVFIQANLKPENVDRIAVCSGPGSFTGLRVALSFAKGFALPRNLPVVGINALEVTAHDLWLSDEDEGRMPVYKDIRRGEAFYCEYQSGRPLMNPQSMQLSEAKRRSLKLGRNVETYVVDTRILAWMAIDRNPADYPAEPLYSRGPDAKLPGGKSLPNA